MLQRGKVFCFFISILSLLCSCRNEEKKPSLGAPEQQIKDYPVVTITPRKFLLKSDYPATIEGQQNVEIRPKIDGYIEKIFVDEGATVREGQKLFQISAPQYEQEVRTAEANIKIAKASVNAAEMEVNKVRPLVEKNIISKYELEAAQYNLESKKAALAQAQATLANAKTNLGYTLITSPVDGVIGTIPYKIGSLVSSNIAQPLTTVSNISNIYAYFSINEKQALQFSSSRKGTTTEERLKSIPPVTLVLANGNEFQHKGKIDAATGLVNTQTGSIRVRATFPNPGNLIRSGSSGKVRIPTLLDSALLVPQKATYEMQGKIFVFLVNASGKVNATEIKIRPNSGGYYYVVESGLKPGDRIVVEGVATLQEGSTIKARPVNADSVFSKTVEEVSTGI